MWGINLWIFWDKSVTKTESPNNMMIKWQKILFVKIIMIDCYNTYLESWHTIFRNYICCPKWSHLKTIVILLDICQKVYGICSYSGNQWVQLLWWWIQWYQFHFTICATQSIGLIFLFQNLTRWANRVHRNNNNTVVVTVVNWHIVTESNSI